MLAYRHPAPDPQSRTEGTSAIYGTEKNGKETNEKKGRKEVFDIFFKLY